MFSLKTYANSLNYTRKKTFLTVAALSLGCLTLTGAVQDSGRKNVTVTVVDNFSGVDLVENVTTRNSTVGDLLSELNISLEESDIISLGEDDILRDGDKITIKKGRSVTIECDGRTRTVNATDKRVGELLETEAVTVYANDIVAPSADSIVHNGDVIKITRVAYNNYKKETVEVPYNTVVLEDETLDIGTSYVKQTGVKGEKEVSYATTYHDGEEVGYGIVNETVLTPAVDEIVVKGTKKNYHKGFSYSKKLTVEATAYEPYNCGGDGRGITASGLKAQFGVVAVDPKVIPLGTKLYIESTDNGASWVYGYCIAADTGGAIKKNRIDLCYNTMSECIQFGRRSANVYILE